MITERLARKPFVGLRLYVILMFMRFGQNQDAAYYGEPSKGWGLKKRLIIIVGGAIGLILIFALAFTFLSGNGETTAKQTLKMAQQHTELIRIAEMGAKQSVAQDTKNTATTVKLVLQSSQSQITAIASRGQKVSSAQLSGSKNTKTDTLLETAKQNNRFDEAFLETLYAQLKTYQKSLKSTASLLSSAKDKQTLNDLSGQIAKLLPKTN